MTAMDAALADVLLAWYNGHHSHVSSTQQWALKTCQILSHRLFLGVKLLVQLSYELDAPIDSVRGTARGFRLELPPPLRMPLVEQHIHRDCVLHAQQRSSHHSPESHCIALHRIALHRMALHRIA